MNPISKSREKILSQNNPPEGARIDFLAATVFARKIVIGKKLVVLTGCDRGQKASLDVGWIIIDKQWYPASKPKADA